MGIITAADYATLTNQTLTPAQTVYVNALIPVVQDEIERYCDRYFDSADYLEWFKYSKYIVLRQYPVTAIKYLGELDEVGVFSNSTDYTYEFTSTTLKVTDGNLSTTTITFGGAISNLTDIKTAFELAYPLVTLTITSGYNLLSYKLIRPGTGTSIMGAKRNDCQTKLIEDENRTLEIMMDSAFQFWVATDYTTDVNVFIAYTAGYSSTTMPKMLQMVMCNIVKDVMNIQSAGITGLYESETITNYSYKLGANVTAYVGQEITKYYGDLEVFRKRVI